MGIGTEELVGISVVVEGGIEVITTLEEVTSDVAVVVEEARVLVSVRNEVVRLTV